MTLSHWYREYGESAPKPAAKAKIMSRASQLDQRLKSILLERCARSNKLLRQQAGLDSARSKASKCRRASVVPEVCKFQQEYDRNRAERARSAIRAQQQLRQFHSLPVPNFSAHHKRWELRNKTRQLNALQKITEPQTPRTLINSMKASKRWEAEMLSIQESNMKEITLRPNLLTKSSDSWRKPPYVPSIWSSIVKTKPFKLQSQKRGEQRKEFDKWNQRKQEARCQANLVAASRRWQQEYQQARQLTNFKARPNPWKRTKAKL
ncbi:uncharacterized protein LOC115765484 [Drosophila novamexicana]|uniref:uncharacterized protein LOC115765484 n=1 Tax=Drosophila novamexicana TaxID=47314 RepID=UPI0011E604AC|nr:uncharacterized protein LOC115765484 [Drosophila novamexicana]